MVVVRKPALFSFVLKFLFITSFRSFFQTLKFLFQKFRVEV